jgi:hypothetical protein
MHIVKEGTLIADALDVLRCSMFMAKFFRVAIMWCVNYGEGLKGFVEQSEEWRQATRAKCFL